MNLDALLKRANTLRKNAGQQLDASALQRVQALIQNGLSRKLALLKDGIIPADYHEQCQRIDQGHTPADRDLLVRYNRVYPSQPGARERLMQRIDQYREAMQQ